jgi:hypothetical protein
LPVEISNKETDLWASQCKIAIIWRGRAALHREFQVMLSLGGTGGVLDTFVEHRLHKPLLSTSMDISGRDFANLIESKAYVVVEDMTGYSASAIDYYIFLTSSG